MVHGGGFVSLAELPELLGASTLRYFAAASPQFLHSVCAIIVRVSRWAMQLEDMHVSPDCAERPGHWAFRAVIKNENEG